MYFLRKDRSRSGNAFSVLAFCFAVSHILMISGCDSGPKTYDVTGTVTFRGEMVTSGLINFQPAEGQPFGGGIQTDGSFSFELPAGEYKVRVTQPVILPEGWKEGDPLPPNYGRSALPARYARYESSRLAANISENPESHTMSFELE